MSSENQTQIEVPVGNSCTSVVQWSDHVHQDQGRTQRGAAGAVAPPEKIKLAIFILL